METSFGLDSDLSTFNETAVRHELGIAYGVPPEYIVLNVSAGSVVVDVLIVLPESAAATLPSHEVQRQMASINASALSISLGSQVTNLSSVSVSNRSYMTSRVMLRFREISCFPGHWCTGGAVIPCEGGPGAVGHTYNPFINQDLGSACLPCQEHAVTQAIGTVEPRDCVCNPSFLRLSPPPELEHNTTAQCKCGVGYELKQEHGGEPECMMCQHGKYKAQVANRLCDLCDDLGLGGRVTTLLPGAESSDACLCAANYFMSEQGSCELCESRGQTWPRREGSTDCRLPGTTLYTLPLRPGFWRVNHLFWQPLRTPMPGTVSARIYPCFSRTACVGTNNYTSPSALLFDDNASNPCAEGHHGAFCGACHWPEYHMNKVTEACELCESSGDRMATLATAIAGVCVVAFAMLAACIWCLICPACFHQTLKTASKPVTTDELLQALRPALTTYLKKVDIHLDDAMWGQVVKAAALVDSKEEIEQASKDPGAFMEKLVRLSASTLGPIAFKILRVRLKPLLKRVKLPQPLTWDDLWPALELIESVEELQEAVRNPSAFVQRLLKAAVGPALLKAAIHVAMPKIKQVLEKKLPSPLTWPDVEPALLLIDTVDEVHEAAEDPEAFLKRVLDDVAGPVAMRVLIAKARPSLKPHLVKARLAWNDVLPQLVLISDRDELLRALEDPASLIQTAKSSTAAKAKARPSRDPCGLLPSPPASPPAPQQAQKFSKGNLKRVVIAKQAATKTRRRRAKKWWTPERQRSIMIKVRIIISMFQVSLPPQPPAIARYPKLTTHIFLLRIRSSPAFPQHSTSRTRNRMKPSSNGWERLRSTSSRPCPWVASSRSRSTLCSLRAPSYPSPPFSS